MTQDLAKKTKTTRNSPTNRYQRSRATSLKFVIFRFSNFSLFAVLDHRHELKKDMKKSVIILSLLLQLLLLKLDATEVGNLFDLENIDSTELNDANLRRAVSALSFDHTPKQQQQQQSSIIESNVDSSEVELLAPLISGDTGSGNDEGVVVGQSETAELSGVAGKGRCELINVPMCRNLAYNMTSMPNQFEHTTQSEAAAEAHQFWALVEFNCAPELKFFLCSMYTPICIPG